MIHSRQLFLRTIMHELKTPIGKGKLVTEMLDDEIAKKRLSGIFARLDLLIAEFSKVEQIASKSCTPNIASYTLLHVLDQAIDLLMLDAEKTEELIKIEGDFDFEVNVDFDLMALAIKNLIDNALKHSAKQQIHVSVYEKKLLIENKGEPLSMSIEEYFQPFVSGSKTHGSGLGLGLYIVQNIVKLHGFEVSYHYIDGMHQFSIDFTKGQI